MPKSIKGKDIMIGWTKLLKEQSERPEGYSSVEEIAEKLNISGGTARARLNKLRKENKIECMQTKIGRGVGWVYKD